MISVVVPVHDEEQSLPVLYGELDAVFAGGASARSSSSSSMTAVATVPGTSWPGFASAILGSRRSGFAATSARQRP